MTNQNWLHVAECQRPRWLNRLRPAPPADVLIVGVIGSCELVPKPKVFRP